MAFPIRIARTVPANVHLLLPIPKDAWKSFAKHAAGSLDAQEKTALARTNASLSREPDTALLPLWTGRRWLVLALLEPIASLTTRTARDAGEMLTERLRAVGIDQVFLVRGPVTRKCWQALQEGMALGSYAFTECKGTLPEEGAGPSKHTPVTFTFRQAQDLVPPVRLRIIADAVALTKDIVNRPPNSATPAALEKASRELAQRFPSMNMKVLQGKQLEAHGLRGISAVGRGSAEEPRLILIDYAPVKGKPLLLVGKGVAFDTGGLSLKRSENMVSMKQDLTGAATVLGVLQGAAEMNVRRRIVGVIPAVENMIGARAYRPDDVIRMVNGVTVEVTNTDAEGRIILGDALAYASEQYRPERIIDLATLTGGCAVAVGEDIAAIPGNDPRFVGALRRAADDAGEPLWELPLHKPYRKFLRSKVADIVNLAEPLSASTIQGGLFLQHFVPEKTPWCHIDIASVAFDDEKNRATGRMVRTLLHYLESRNRA